LGGYKIHEKQLLAKLFLFTARKALKLGFSLWRVGLLACGS
jgi:hypothetical protein